MAFQFPVLDVYTICLLPAHTHTHTHTHIHTHQLTLQMALPPHPQEPTYAGTTLSLAPAPIANSSQGQPIPALLC